MAVTELFARGWLGGAALRLLDLRRVKQRRDDGRRADSDRDTGFYQLAAPFFVPLVVVHKSLSNWFSRLSYAFDAAKGSRV